VIKCLNADGMGRVRELTSSIYPLSSLSNIENITEQNNGTMSKRVVHHSKVDQSSVHSSKGGDSRVAQSK